MGVESIVEKMKRQPNGVKYNEAAKVLKEYGYELVRKKGSHRHFRNDEGDLITILEEKPLKAVYVKDIIRRIEK